MYGQSKIFETSAGKVRADTKAEATQLARSIAGEAPTFVRGPRFMTALRGEPKGNRLHSEVYYAGTRAAVRKLNQSFA